MTIITSHTETDDLGGGKFQTRIGIKPIAYLKNGVYVRDPFELGNSGDAALSVGCSGITDFRIRPKLSGNAPLIHFGRGQSHVRFTPLNTNNVQGVALGKNQWLYPDAWANADYRLSYGGHRVDDDILLRAGHPQSFAFRIDDHSGLNFDTLQTSEFRILDPVLIAPDSLTTIPLTWEKSNVGGKLALTVRIPSGQNFSGWTLDPVLVLQPDATDGKDTALISNAPANNFGVAVLMYVGENNTAAQVARELIKFTLTAIPPSAIISTCALGINQESELASNTRSLRAYRQLRAWLEGTRNGADDTIATGATWVRFDTTQNWQVAGGFGVLDCEQTDIGSISLSATEANGFKTIALTPSAVQAWISGAFANNGLLLKMDTEADDQHRFTSSDGVTPANRPTLTTTYTLPGGGIFNQPFAAPFRGAFG